MKKMIVAIMVFAAMLSAAVVSVDRAQNVAENYYKNYAPSAVKGNAVREVLTKEYLGQPTWYAFNFDEGFVIVSAEDNVRAILGYSFTGEVRDINDTNNPFVRRFSIYDKEIVHIAREQGYVDTEQAKVWKDIENNIFPSSSKATVGPLVESTFGQGYPWNEMCPIDDGGPALVGCVATAMHQIMRYHQGPTNGYGASSYYWNGGDVAGGQTLSVDYSAATYDYANQPLDGNVSTQTEIDELAKMSYHAGVSVEMDYATSASGAYSTDVEYAMETYFGYMAQTAYQSFGTITDNTTFNATIVSNINDGLPLYWSGTDTGGYGGHAFILDGYTDNYYYHFNWGWSGGSDGWFQLSALTAGGYNFSDGQACVYNIDIDSDLDLWKPAQNVAGTIANSEDVTLTWDAPEATTATLTGYNIYRNNVLYASVATTPRSFDDNNLSKGLYNYVVKATYTGPDGESPVSNTWQADISPDPNFPIATGVAAVCSLYQRQKIDISWNKPYTGTIAFEEDWESTSFNTDWYKYRTTALEYRGGFGAEVTDGWFLEDGSGLGAEYIYEGLYSAAIGYTAPDFSWLVSPIFTVGANMEVTYWTWNTGNAGSGWLTNYYVTLYDTGNGDLASTDISVNSTPIASFVGIDETTGNTWTSQEVIDISAYSGDYRLCYVYEYTDGYQMAVDNIIVGTAAKSAPLVNNNAPEVVDPERLTVSADYTADTSGLGPKPALKAKADQPTSYDIYRNGSLLANVAVTGTSEEYDDTNPVDGANEYYIKTNYPTGTSIPSTRAAATMDKFPQPDYLTGAVISSSQVDLSWYKPYYNPPMWYTYGYDGDALWNTIDGYTKEADRILFLGSDLGFFYPATVDSIAAAFGEYEDLFWNSSNMTYELYTSATDGSDSVLYTSATLTATDGFFTTDDVPSQVMNQGWYFKIIPGDTSDGSPFLYMDMIEETGYNSHFSASLNDGSGAGWYGISFGAEGLPAEPLAMCFLTSSPSPDISKSGWAGNTIDDKFTDKDLKSIAKDYTELNEPFAQDRATKALDNYNVYRNGSIIGTTSNTTYSDMSPATGDYYITASWSNPAGESAASNIYTVSDLTADQDINLPVSPLAATAQPEGSTTENIAVENLGGKDLTWSASFEYVTWPGMKADITVHSNNFDSGLGSYTDNGVDIVWTATGGQAVLNANTGGNPNGNASATLTSPAFDGTGASALSLAFDQNFTNAGESSIAVEYYDGSTWTQIYSSTASTTASQDISLPNIAANMQVRFTGNMKNRSGDSWSIDNVVVSGPENIAYDWLRLDGAETTLGVTPGGSSSTVVASFDATGCPEGLYEADVTFTSDDPDEPTVVLPVDFTVSTSTPLVAPANVVTSISGTDITISWDAVTGAASYNVYSSADPYGTYSLLTNVGTESYTVTTATKLFYYITATDGAKTAAPKTINIVKPSSSR